MFEWIEIESRWIIIIIIILYFVEIEFFNFANYITWMFDSKIRKNYLIRDRKQFQFQYTYSIIKVKLLIHEITSFIIYISHIYPILIAWSKTKLSDCLPARESRWKKKKKKKERSIPFEFITVCTISPAQPISLKITFNIVLFLEFRTKEKQR